MKNTSLSRKTPLAQKSYFQSKRTKIATVRKSRPKATPARQSARDQDCTIQLPECPNDRSTVVLCHLRKFGGGGTGMKPDDAEAVYGCAYCHDRLDGRAPLWLGSNESVYEYIAWAIIRTHRIMRAAGVLVFKGEKS